MNRSGVTLIELLVASLILTLVGLSFARLAPKVSQDIVMSRMRWTANQLAASKLEELKLKSYPLLELTETSYPGAFPSVTAPDGCRCADANFASIPVLATKSTGSVTYMTQACVNLTDATGTSHCEVFGDTNLKNIHVRVAWQWQNQRESVFAEGTISRL